jgi:hypothetical protein
MGGKNMVIIKRMDALSLAKIQGILGVAFGLIAGIFIGIIASVFQAMLDATMASEAASGEFIIDTGFFKLGWAAVIVLPILYGIMFFIMGLISAWLYNLAAKLVGGMQIELEDESKSSRPLK